MNSHLKLAASQEMTEHAVSREIAAQYAAEEAGKTPEQKREEVAELAWQQAYNVRQMELHS